MWQSAPSSLAVSLAFSTEWEPERRAPLGLLAGLAAVSTFEQELTVGDLALKWPNDVVSPRGKVAGLLLESRDDVVVAGMGVNFQWAKAPPGAASLLGRPATDDERERVARSWGSGVLERSAAGPQHWGHAEYTNRCVTIGKQIRWEPAGEGIVDSVSATGELVVRTEQGIVHLRSADVWEVRTA